MRGYGTRQIGGFLKPQAFARVPRLRPAVGGGLPGLPNRLMQPMENYSKTSLLLPMFGAHGGVTFTDYSQSLKTITRRGDTKTVTEKSKFYGSSAYFDGSGDYLEIANSASLTLSGDFCIESWVYPTASAAMQIYDDETISYYGLLFQKVGDNKLAFVYMPDNSADKGSSGNLITINGTTAIGLNVWSHVAATRNGSSIRLFVNGVLDATATLNVGVGIYNAGGSKYVGARGATGANYFSGYMQDLRITNGVPHYTGAFTPPQRGMIVTTTTGFVPVDPYV